MVRGTHPRTRQSMVSSIFTVRVDASVKRGLEKLAKDTGRSCSCLAAEALREYIATNAWQVAGIEKAMASLEQGQGVAHETVREWVDS